MYVNAYGCVSRKSIKLYSVYKGMFAQLHVHTNVLMYVQMYVCMYVYMYCPFVQMCVCMCVRLLMQEIPPEEALAFDIVTYIGCAVSLACLILTVIFYLLQG